MHLLIRVHAAATLAIDAPTPRVVDIVVPGWLCAEELSDFSVAALGLLHDHDSPDYAPDPPYDVNCSQQLEETDDELSFVLHVLLSDAGRYHGSRPWQDYVQD